MSEQVSLETENLASRRWGWWLVAGLLFLLLIWLGVQFFGEVRPLKPLRETAVPPNITINAEPLLIDFDNLNESPTDYVNLRIQVSGNYLRLEPISCAPFSGPRIQWGLVAAGLQLNASGFEAVVLPIVPADTAMVLEGIWRRYPGPAGCGKEPASGLWFLDVEQIVRPNPLVAGTVTPGGVLPLTPQPFPGTVTATPTLAGSPPPIGSTPVPIPNVTIVGTVLGTSTIKATTAATAVPGTATATSPSTDSTATLTPSPQSGTPTAALPTPTIDLTTSATPSSTPGSGTSPPPPTNPPLVTATPGDGYPGPTISAPTPTLTPTPYP